jgi:hypothetical protein
MKVHANRVIALVALLALCSVPGLPQVPNAQTVKIPEGFAPLFDGKTIDGAIALGRLPLFSQEPTYTNSIKNANYIGQFAVAANFGALAHNIGQ